MRKILFLMAAASVVLSAQTGCQCFAPSPEQIARFEERAADLPEPIYHYARYYAGSILPAVPSQGPGVVRRRIFAEFIRLQEGEASAVHIVRMADLPPPKGEACIARLDDPPDNDAFLLVVRCNRPGGWKPDAADIAALEQRLVLPPGAAPLTSYARHYAGITESGVRLIEGVFLSRTDEPAQRIVESEIALPMIVGHDCRQLEVRYNPETQQGSVSCGAIDP